MGWTFYQWELHMKDRHGYVGPFLNLLPGTVHAMETMHDLDHDDPVGLGHVHTDASDPSKVEER